MNLSYELKEKLLLLKREIQKIEEFVNFKFFNIEDIEEEQIGYSIDQDGNFLVSGKEGSWESGWIVIGCENLCGDPIIMDIKEEGFPISLLMHGMGDWSGGTYLSESIDKFINEIKCINNFISEKSMKNTNPRITCRELDDLIYDIIEKNEYGDVDIWKDMLEPIYTSTKEYEDTIINKVKIMSKEGMKINEISTALNMSVKDTYEYLKN
ncbi:hypothetical protein CTM_06401 [Clostridium tetanomorphum DSM 665]|uniref:hypothetical protein n=1 Tax=Clostridium tetanomorphum TaxID=1553 RepID=UPI00044BF034|nr:hypothetical protein [Clostridium tetanomorphum]KAJ52594.1 hypothetical protein CTM_06401 [Clostridium tetanomorphum DSM 665]NRZ97508.1 hypothetical protein [Clostridium tetanomorphum]SQB92347.1 Uncharacterised protein [Clostridium tetanomorphum]